MTHAANTAISGVPRARMASASVGPSSSTVGDTPQRVPRVSCIATPAAQRATVADDVITTSSPSGP
jgi:hypothetical protein